MSVPETLLALAPADLPVRRPDRFDGAGFGLPLDIFDPADRDTLALLYGVVKGVYDLWLGMKDRPDIAALEAHLAGLDADHLAAAAGRLHPAGPGDPRVRKALHDIRGGGLTVLLGTAELVRALPGQHDLVRGCVWAARDHAKMMRAVLPDLDPPAYAADESARVHPVNGFVETWDGMTVSREGRPVSVSVRCEYYGALTARCLETASVDRIVYNYVNNATRFTADDRVALWVFPVGDGLVRWVVANAVAPANVAWLNQSTGGDLRRLFAGGLTRGGNGIGLSNCAEIVAGCFGLGSPADAVGAGYLGAKVVGSDYHAWFHWPAYRG